MRNFYTKNTVEAPNYCRICGKETQWKIDGGHPTYCIPCYNKPRPEPNVQEKKVQKGLFDRENCGDTIA